MLQIPPNTPTTPTTPITPRLIQFRIHAQATHNEHKVSPVAISKLFYASSKSSYCNLSNTKLKCSVDVSKIDHIDNVVIRLSAIEENTTPKLANTFASVNVNIGDYRGDSKQKTWLMQCCEKKNKYTTTSETSIATKGRLTYGQDESTRKLKRETVNNTASSELDKQIAKWRTGYLAFKIKGNNLPTKLVTKNNAMTRITSVVKPTGPTTITTTATGTTKMKSIYDIDAATVDIQLTLKTLMRTQQTSSNDELDRINIESDRKRFVKDRQTLCIIVGIVILFLISGAIYYPLVEGWTVLDSLYFGVTTLTTVGYGDMGPTSDGAKIFTALYVFFGVAIVATCIGVATTFLIQSAALRAEIEKKKRREETMIDDDSDDDSDDDEELDDEDDHDSAVVSIKKENQSDATPKNICFSRCMKRGLFFLHEFFPALCCCTIGICVMMYFQEESFVDAFYWSIVTGTTVGYGDVSPLIPATRAFALIYLFVAVITMGKALSAFGTLLDSDDGHDALLLNRKLDETFLNSLDQDGTGEVSEFEYLSAMLVLLEYVEQDDIDRVMKAFRKLDLDGSGSLTVEDLSSNLTSNVNNISSDLKRPHRVFKDCDTNGNGSLEPNEVRTALKMLGSTMDDVTFNEMFREMDKDQDGSVCFKEFKKVLYKRIVYEAIDDDINGSLDREEIRESFLCILKMEITNAEFDTLYHELDCDKDGSVSFTEYKNFFRHPKEQKDKILAARRMIAGEEEKKR